MTQTLKARRSSKPIFINPILSLSLSLVVRGVDLPPVHGSKLRWGDIDEDDGESLDSLLPPREIIGPDENGVKKVTSLIKRAFERRAWSKFGDAVDEDVSARLTMVSTEEILLERPRAPGTLAIFFFL